MTTGVDHRDLAFNKFIELAKKFGVNDHGTVVLDVGCYDDHLQPKFKEAGFKWFGMDPAKGQGVLVKGYMEDIPLHTDFVSVVFCCHAFEHTTNPIQTVKEFHRILKPRHYVFMSTPYPCQMQIFAMDETHNFVLTQDQLLHLFQHNGFMLMHTEIIKPNDEEKDWSIITMAVKT